jgi:hypothetical protein
MPRCVLCIICCVIFAASVSASAQRVAVSSEEAQSWIRYTVPLPKSIEISAKVTLPKSQVALDLPKADDIVTAQMGKELFEALGRVPGSQLAAPAFSITLQLGGSEAEKLRSLKNSDQAYCIAPEPGDKGLKIAALTPVGLYYGAKTLQQLIKPYATGDSLTIPLMTVTDWPDLEDRGTWGSNNYEWLRWFGDRKLNIVEQITARSVDKDGKGHSELKSGRESMITEGPKYGIRAVPAVLHLEQVAGCAYDVYPNLKPKGEKARGFCYSQPQVVDIIADWVADLGSLPNVYGVDVWMAENLHGEGGCQCDECKKTDRSLLEARTIFKAWKKAEEKLGRKIQLYILTSEETVKSNPAILAEMPEGVRFWYYQWLTYNTSHAPMIKDYMVDAAKRGQWIGCVPNLDSMTHFLEPFTGADFIHARMNEFVDKGLKGLLGYVTPLVHYNFFNLEAAAEWSWNSKGRTPKEFSLSYAIRQGFKDPQKWAEWAQTVGPVEWDIYGSEWTSGAQRGIPDPVAKSLLEGKLPKLGTVAWDCFWIPFGDIKSVKQLDDDVAAAAKALEMSKQMGTPQYYFESLTADGYIKSLKALYELGRIVKNGAVAERNREAARKYFRMYDDGLKQAGDAMPKWEVEVDINHKYEGFTDKAVRMSKQLRDEMAATAAKLGVDY